MGMRQLARTHPGLLARHALDEMGRLFVHHVGEGDGQKVLLEEFTPARDDPKDVRRAKARTTGFECGGRRVSGLAAWRLSR